MYFVTYRLFNSKEEFNNVFYSYNTFSYDTLSWDEMEFAAIFADTVARHFNLSWFLLIIYANYTFTYTVYVNKLFKAIKK